MKRIVVFLFLLVLFFGFVSTDASNVKKIDLNLQDGEVDVVFIKLKTSNSILFIGDQNSNLFVLDYINSNKLMESLKIFNTIPNIYYIQNKEYQRFNNVHVFYDGMLKFRSNNYTLCVYEDNDKINGCDFIYFKKVSNNLRINTDFAGVFYDEDINQKKLMIIQESWVDKAIVSTDSYTILKLYENSYDILVVPSTN